MKVRKITSEYKGCEKDYIRIKGLEERLPHKLKIGRKITSEYKGWEKDYPLKIKFRRKITD